MPVCPSSLRTAIREGRLAAGYEHAVGRAWRLASYVEPEANDAVADGKLRAVIEDEVQDTALPRDQGAVDDRAHGHAAAVHIDQTTPFRHNFTVLREQLSKRLNYQTWS